MTGAAHATRALPLFLLALGVLAAVAFFVLRPEPDDARSAQGPDAPQTAPPVRNRVSPAPRATPAPSSDGADGPWDTEAPESTRLERVTALAAGPAEASRAELIAAAQCDPSPEVRASALEALEADDSLAALSAFVGALSDPEEWVREAASMGIYRFPSREHATGALAGVCRTDDRELRIRAAELLDEMVDRQLPWDEIDGGPVVFAWAPPDPFEEGR